MFVGCKSEFVLARIKATNLEVSRLYNKRINPSPPPSELNHLAFDCKSTKILIWDCFIIRHFLYMSWDMIYLLPSSPPILSFCEILGCFDSSRFLWEGSSSTTSFFTPSRPESSKLQPPTQKLSPNKILLFLNKTYYTYTIKNIATLILYDGYDHQ